MKTHYEPYDPNLEDECNLMCGTEVTENSRATNNWNYVSCKKCLKSKSKINKAVEYNEKIIVQQMGDMAYFMKNNK